jgi:predicted Zn-dependent peptidase
LAALRLAAVRHARCPRNRNKALRAKKPSKPRYPWTPDYHAADLLSDVLSAGESGRLQRRLVMERELFSDLEAYVMGSMDAGLFVVEGKFAEGVDQAEAEAALEAELVDIRQTRVSQDELEKVRNQSEAHEAFGNVSVLNKAMKLCYFELLGDAADINTETERYRAVSAADIQRVARDILRPERANTLNYRAKRAVPAV